MTFDESQQNELAYLILLAVEGKINKDGFDRLEILLKSHPDARRLYADILDVHLGLDDVDVQLQWRNDKTAIDFNFALFELLAEYEKIAPTAPQQASKQSDIPKIEKVQRGKVIPNINKASLITAIGSLAAMVLLVTFGYLLPPKTMPPVARITRTCNAQWAAGRSRLEAGSELYPGTIHLVEGVIELLMDSGATVLLEAPVRVDIESSSRLFLRRGRLVAVIRNGVDERFVVRTPFSTIVDYGTEFGVKVDSAATLARVYEGQIELRSGTDPLKYTHSIKLNTDQGGLVNASGEVVRTNVPAHTFIRHTQFETMRRAAQGQRYYQWKAFNDQLHRDQSLVAHYTFDQSDSSANHLVNTAPQTGSVLNGALSFDEGSPSWTAGRWPQKYALRFDRNLGGRVVVPARPELAITGPVTIAAWIYLEHEDQYGHIVSCREGTQVNYQLSWFGPSHPDTPHRNKIQLLRYYEQQTVRGYSDVVSLEPQQWHFLAATHDNQTIRFYLNGKLISKVNDPVHPQPVIAELVIGDVLLRGHAQWRFDGIIDEIVVLSRIMNASELDAMYQAGIPRIR